MTISEFLLARIAEDEDAARGGKLGERFGYRYDPPPWGGAYEAVSEDPCSDRSGTYLAVDPNRLAAECEAKRRIVERHQYGSDVQGGGWLEATSRIVRDLAAVYASHPDYDQEWAL